jgi:hypothetical protein
MAEPTDLERALLTGPGLWTLGLVATCRGLTGILIDHVMEAHGIEEVSLMDDIYEWYLNAVEIGVDVTAADAYMEQAATGSDQYTRRFIAEFFIGPLERGLQIPARQATAQLILARLPQSVLDLSPLNPWRRSDPKPPRSEHR